MQVNDVLFGLTVGILVIVLIKMVVDEIRDVVNSRRITRQLQKYTVTLSDEEKNRLKQRREMAAVKRRVAEDLVKRGIVGRERAG